VDRSAWPRKRGHGTRGKIALVATAHYLVRVMHAMMRSGACWHEKEQTEKRVA